MDKMFEEKKMISQKLMDLLYKINKEHKNSEAMKSVPRDLMNWMTNRMDTVSMHFLVFNSITDCDDYFIESPELDEIEKELTQLGYL